jgi:hypothetical protein
VVVSGASDRQLLKELCLGAPPGIIAEVELRRSKRQERGRSAKHADRRSEGRRKAPDVHTALTPRSSPAHGGGHPGPRPPVWRLGPPLKSSPPVWRLATQPEHIDMIAGEERPVTLTESCQESCDQRGD